MIETFRSALKVLHGVDYWAGKGDLLRDNEYTERHLAHSLLRVSYYFVYYDMIGRNKNVLGLITITARDHWTTTLENFKLDRIIMWL